MNNKQKIGYFLTLAALGGLIVTLSWMSLTTQGTNGQKIIRAIIVLLPLLWTTKGVFLRQRRRFAALALLAPIYMLIGGIVWLWADVLAGFLICFAAAMLEIGAILHNYQKRKRKDKPASR